MNITAFQASDRRERFGLKGPAAAAWLEARGIAVPAAPNTWAGAGDADRILVARLGTAEFFLEDSEEGSALRAMRPAPEMHPPGVYPVLREDAAYILSGPGVHEVLAQVCNVNFEELRLDANPVLMTMMIGVSVLVVPQASGGGRQYRIWCDPSFGPYLRESFGTVIGECGNQGSN